MAVDIFEYSDFRRYLADAYADRKRQDVRFSYRLIASKAGFKSPAFFSQIIKGKTNISMRSAFSLAAVFKLKAAEVEFFENLVQLNQAKNQADKQYYFGKLVALKKGKIRTLDESQYEIFTKWYYIAIRELVGMLPFKGDYQQLAEVLVPRITASEARDAVKALERLNLISRDSSGRWQKADAAVSTGDYWTSVAITQFQLEAMDLARKSFDLIDGDYRDHSTLTLSISDGEFRWIREQLGIFRKRILEMARNSPQPDRVYQINFNVFPLTDVNHGK